MLAGNTGVIVSIIVGQPEEKSSQAPHYLLGSKKPLSVFIIFQRINIPAFSSFPVSLYNFCFKKAAEIIAGDNKGLEILSIYFFSLLAKAVKSDGSWWWW